MAVEVRQRGRRPVVYYNVYNQGEVDDLGRPRGRTTFQRVFIDARVEPVPQDTAAVMLGDFNEHHSWWSLVNGAPRRQAREMVDWLRDRNFALANDFNEPTFASHDTGLLSVLDLVFYNPAAGRLDAVYGFRVDAAASGASDHFALLWESPPSAEPVTNVTGCKFNWKLAVEADFVEAFRARLDETGHIIRLIMDAAYIPTTEEVERATRCYQDAMVYAAQKTVPERRDSTYAKPWWNGELDDAKEILAAAKDALRGLTRAQAEAQAERVRKLTHRFRRMAKRIKRRYFRDLLANASTKELWEYKGWTGGKRTYPTPPLDQGPDLPLAAEHADKCAALRRAHFRPPTDLGVQPPDLSAPRLHARAHQKVGVLEASVALDVAGLSPGGVEAYDIGVLGETR
ncbi:hypothetical protein EXIGLDRAFT_783691 [Exidia glandulosa HHB12029]|uniref:Endonuclease/exonuclease/phosphatase domain-containing protein n=1 Tax=Exidia glandulosa HHB12029 TaxID=1314781 RepID=A0A166MX71_EXIGL|nr:hypothetical protein EXIGLDRAFT_783691 [Exidia glandulosa HHB12029]